MIRFSITITQILCVLGGERLSSGDLIEVRLVTKNIYETLVQQLFVPGKARPILSLFFRRASPNIHKTRRFIEYFQWR